MRKPKESDAELKAYAVVSWVQFSLKKSIFLHGAVALIAFVAMNASIWGYSKLFESANQGAETTWYFSTAAAVLSGIGIITLPLSVLLLFVAIFHVARYVFSWTHTGQYFVGVHDKGMHWVSPLRYFASFIRYDEIVHWSMKEHPDGVSIQIATKPKRGFKLLKRMYESHPYHVDTMVLYGDNGEEVKNRLSSYGKNVEEDLYALR